MTSIDSGRPMAGEHIPYFGQYIELVPDGDILDTLTQQIEATTAFFGTLTEEQARWRPAPGEWTVLQIVGHLADTERVLGYRALRIARNDRVMWESIDFETYVEHGGFDERELGSLVNEFVTVREGTLAWLRGLGDAAWERRMPDEWSCRTVRALAWLIAGHELHHVDALKRERALVR